jgi:ribosomal protein S11
MLAKKKKCFFLQTSLDDATKKYSEHSCNLIIKTSRSNIFITLTDLAHRVIICKTSGSAKVGARKKKKVSPHAIENIISSSTKYLRFYRIRVINIILRIKPNIRVFVLVKALIALHIRIASIIDNRRIIHGAMRSRKIRRI